MKRAEVNLKHKDTFPQLHNVSLIWVIAFYDGPLTGLMKFNGKFYRFEAEGETLFQGKRIAWGIEIDAAQLEIYRMNSWDYQAYNSKDCFFDNDWVSFVEKKYPKKAWQNKNRYQLYNVFDRHHELFCLDFGQNPVLGWFYLKAK